MAMSRRTVQVDPDLLDELDAAICLMRDGLLHMHVCGCLSTAEPFDPVSTRTEDLLLRLQRWFQEQRVPIAAVIPRSSARPR